MADLTRDVDKPVPIAAPPRQSVDMKERPLDDDDDPTSASEDTFATVANRVKLSDEERAELTSLLIDVLDSIKAERAGSVWEENWDLWEDLYFGIVPERAYGVSNVHVPLSQEVVDTAMAVEEQALFPNWPATWLGVMPREEMDVEVAKRKEDHLNYAFQVEMNTRENIEPVLWEANALGTGVLHLPWLRELDRIRDEEIYDPLDVKDMERFNQRYPKADEDHPKVTAKLRAGKKVRLVVEYTEAIHDAPDITYIPIRDWIVRPTAKPHRLHRERFVGHRFPLRWADIEAQELDNYYDHTEDIKFKFDVNGDKVDNPRFQDEEHEIVTGIVRWRRHGDPREKRYLVDFHQASRTIVRILRYPYWHNRVNYIPWYIQRSRKFIYGISLIQKIEPSQYEANAAHSLMLDAAAFTSLPMFKARKGSESTFNPLRDGMLPGKTFYFDNPATDAQQFQMSAGGSLGILQYAEQTATRHAELASGALQNLSGVESARDPDAPATKTIAQLQQAMMRIGKYISTLGTALTELGFQVSELYYQFSPEGRIFRVMGPKGVPVFPQIPRNEMRLRADYYPHGSTASLNPEREKRDTFSAIEFLLKAKEVAEDPLKRWAAIEMGLDVMGPTWGQKKHKFLPTSEEMELLRRTSDLKLEEMRLKITQAEQQLKQIKAGGPVAPRSGSPGATPVPTGAPAPRPQLGGPTLAALTSRNGGGNASIPAATA